MSAGGVALGPVPGPFYFCPHFFFLVSYPPSLMAHPTCTWSSCYLCSVHSPLPTVRYVGGGCGQWCVDGGVRTVGYRRCGVGSGLWMWGVDGRVWPWDVWIVGWLGSWRPALAWEEQVLQPSRAGQRDCPYGDPVLPCSVPLHVPWLCGLLCSHLFLKAVAWES